MRLRSNPQSNVLFILCGSLRSVMGLALIFLHDAEEIDLLTELMLDISFCMMMNFLRQKRFILI